MRFSIQNLLWLTVAAAAFSAVIRFFGLPNGGVIVVVSGYLAAPLLLTLGLSFFQRIPAKTRRFAAYVALAVLATLPMLLVAAFALPCALVLALAMFPLWAMQILVFNDLHKDVE